MTTKRILHIIETLERGGAELLFVNYINNLPETFENIVVILRPPDTLKSKLHNYKSIHILGYHFKVDAFRVILRLMKLVRDYKIDLIHSHLYWPTIFSRLAVGKTVPVIYSVHNLISYDAFNLNSLSKFLEQATYSSKYNGLFVSKAVLKDYATYIKIKGSNRVIYNFIRNSFYKDKYRKKAFSCSGLKMVSIGNLRIQKNYLFLINCLRELESLSVSLDIYGDGPECEVLDEFITNCNVRNVRLMGVIELPETILSEYDVFVSSTNYEGFYIAMVEAMAVGLPCIVPDLDVLIEVTGGRQLYYERNNKKSLLDKIQVLLNKPEVMSRYSKDAIFESSKYTQANHIERLTDYYETVLEM